MKNIKNKLLIMSGKGGVGKTTIAVNLAYSLSKKGHKIGLLDIDIHGPNVPKMLGLENEKLNTNNNKLIPLETKEGIKVISMAFLLNKKDAVIWRGPLKHNIIKQFIDDVGWGKLDYLIIDFPPGTGDEAISISQLLDRITGSILISTPHEVSILDVTRTIDFSNKVKIPIIGLIENMSGDIFGKDKVKILADTNNLTFLGGIPLNKEITKSSNIGKPFVIKNSEITKSFEKITNNILSLLGK
jgi:ATP-binding protein involved in chromosome partitioning